MLIIRSLTANGIADAKSTVSSTPIFVVMGNATCAKP